MTWRQWREREFARLLFQQQEQGKTEERPEQDSERHTDAMSGLPSSY